MTRRPEGGDQNTITAQNGDPLATLSAAQKRALLAEMMRKRAAAEPITVPLSIGQQAIWFQQQMAPGSPAYTLVAASRIASALDADLLAAAFEEILARHGQLRAHFAIEDGAPVAVIAPRRELDFERRQLTGADLDAVRAHIREEARRPFDLAEGPLFRVRLYSQGDRAHVLAIIVHHAVFDARSVEIVMEEALTLYGARLAGGEASLPPAPDYGAFVRWQEGFLAGLDGQRQARFWTDRLAGDLPLLDLPFDRPPPTLPALVGETVAITLDDAIVAEVAALARRARVTPFTILLSAFQVLLHRYSGQDDILVGTPTSGRSRPEFERVVGYCVNPVVLRADLSADPSFADLLADNRSRVQAALAHQDFPFPRLVEELGGARHPGRPPVFQVMFGFRRDPLPVLVRSAGSEREDDPQNADGLVEAAGLRIAHLPIAQQEGLFELALEIVQTGKHMHAELRYAGDRFDRDTAARIARHYRTLLSGLIAGPEAAIGHVPLMDDNERRALLARDDDTARPLPRMPVHLSIRAQARKTPTRVAVQAGDVTLTFGELDEAAAALAARLRAAGVGRDAVVGLCLERTIDLVVGLLGILAAGAAFLPIDPRLPRARIAAMIEDAKAHALVVAPELRDGLPLEGLGVFVLPEAQAVGKSETDAPAAEAGDLDDLAYVIFTSGSTGRPKGVEIPHRALANLVQAAIHEFGVGDGDVLVATTTIAFDIAMLELLVPLAAGGRLVLASRDDAADGWRLADLLERSGATLMQSTPSGWRLLIESGWRGRAELRALCGGEPLDAGLATALRARCAAVWNCYGPTETTIWSSLHRLDDAEGPIPIGRPLDNTRIHVLDRHGQPVPPGVVGEIHIGGAGLARGYRGRSDLSAERFVERALDGERPVRLYRTGDLGRRLADGELLCLGRTDHQIKLRGHRIELGEIEAALLATDGLVEAVVLPIGSHARPADAPFERLVAFVVTRGDAALDEAGLRAGLRAHLPDYMIPSAIVALDALPRLVNGKLDRHALLHALPTVAGGAAAARPATASERTIAAVWEELLGHAEIGLYDNFYDLGGHSLQSIRAIARIHDALGVRLDPRNFTYQTLGQLAAACDRKRAEQGGGTCESTNAADPIADAGSVAGGGTPELEPEAAVSLPSTAAFEVRRPFFFGAAGSELFGCLQLPGEGRPRATGIVLCHPFGQEHVRVHRSFVQLGSRLVARGFPVLRFDHYGCGDSAGSGEDGDVDRWRDDITSAIAEMRARTGVTEICLIGVRFGATLAAHAAARDGGLAGLVLWDPVLQGEAYVAELRRLHRELLQRAYVDASRRLEVEEVMGFPLPEALRRGIAALDLAGLGRTPAAHVLLLESGPDAGLASVAEALRAKGTRLDHRHIADEQIWLEEPYRALVPQRVLQAIVAWLAEHAP